MPHTQEPRGPPYPPQTAQIGGLPTPLPDAVLSSLFLAFYVCSAVYHQYVYQTNRRRQHNFKISLPLFGFSMARIMTNILRLVWCYDHHNVSLGIAATIFTNAGTLLLYIVNLLFAIRIFRARHPGFGWNRPLHFFFTTCYILMIPVLIVIITLIVVSAYTLEPKVLEDVREGTLAAITYLTFFAALAPVLLIAAFAIPKSSGVPEHRFGSGSMTSKVLVVATSSALCLTLAGYRCGAVWQTPRPASSPPWWDSKACLYVFIFTLEALTMILFAAARVDLRFHVPDGSSKRRTYEVADAEEKIASRSSSQTEETVAEEEEKKEEV